MSIQREHTYDCVLIGAGPAGLAAGVTFKKAGLDYLHLETGQTAQTIVHYPKKVRLFSERKDLEIGGLRFDNKYRWGTY